MNAQAPPARGSIGELTVYFLRLGLLGFGGPVALVGQMERELVAERGWLSSEQMRESIAICQSLPGPLAIQVGIYISYLRGGFWGAWAGGWAFVLPNFVIVAALGALYVYLGDLQPVTAIFYGVSPAVIALILHSCYRLAKLGMEDPVQWVIAAICLVVTVILNAEVALLFIGAGVVGILYYGNLLRREPPILLQVSAAPVLAQLAPVTSQSTLGKLLLFFLKAGSLTFGSGLVIVPFLEQGLVDAIWLAGPEAVPDRGCSRNDQPRSGRYHRYLCRLPRRRLLGLVDLNHRHLPAVLHSSLGRRTVACQISRQPKCPGLCEGRLCSGNRHDSRRLHPARPHRDRRLADRPHRCCLTRGFVSLESQQSASYCCNLSCRPDRLPTASTRLGHGQIGDFA